MKIWKTDHLQTYLVWNKTFLGKAQTMVDCDMWAAAQGGIRKA